MKQIKHILVVLAVLIAIVPITKGFAGSSQATGEKYFEMDEIAEFAKKVERELAKRGARVAIVARVGRDRSKLPEGVSFTHVAFAVYSQITTGDGRNIPGYTMYNLYQRNEEPDRSDLIQDFPVDFFAGVEVLEAGIIIPTPELQKRLLAVLTSPAYQELHNPDYSVISNPFTLELQNCTEHTLDVIMAAIYQTNDEKTIKANLQEYFEPQKVNINPLKLMLASMVIPDVATSDHPGSPVTATYTTINRFLTRYNGADEVLIISPQAQKTSFKTANTYKNSAKIENRENKNVQTNNSGVLLKKITLEHEMNLHWYGEYKYTAELGDELTIVKTKPCRFDHTLECWIVEHDEFGKGAMRADFDLLN